MGILYGRPDIIGNHIAENAYVDGYSARSHVDGEGADDR